MKNLEKLALEIMAECERDGEPVTKEEALEMAKMEASDKETRRYEKSDTPRKKTTRERKVDEEKKNLFDYFRVLIESLADTDLISVKTESEIHFLHKENSYTLKLIKHRPPKS